MLDVLVVHPTGGKCGVEMTLEKANVLNVELVPTCRRKRAQNRGQPFLQRRNSSVGFKMLISG